MTSTPRNSRSLRSRLKWLKPVSISVLPTETAKVIASLEQLQAELDALVERWAELDA